MTVAASMIPGLDEIVRNGDPQRRGEAVRLISELFFEGSANLKPNHVELFDEILQSSPVPVLVDFWAEWCGPCRSVAPEVSRTAADMAGRAVVLKVDTDKNQQLAARYNVRGIPNLAVFSGGKLVFQQAGVVGHEAMEGWLRSAASTVSA